MGRNLTFTTGEAADIDRLYRDGLSMEAVAKRIGRGSEAAVRNSLLRTGTPIRPRSSPRPDSDWASCPCGQRAAFRSGQCRRCYDIDRNADPRIRDRKFDWWLRKHHGMTRADYDTILAAQNGVCAVHLGPDPRGVKLAIDHDHTCCPAERSCVKCRRGLLCVNCNRAIGLLGDSADNAARLLEYLTR